MSREMKKHSKIPVKKNYTVIEVGYYKYDAFEEKMVEQPFYERGSMSEWEIDKYLPDKNQQEVLEELKRFFDEMGFQESKPKQRKLEL